MDMKLQKLFAYKYGDKAHYKYLITLPQEVIQRLGWKAGGELRILAEEKEKLKMLGLPEAERGMLHIVYVADPSEKPNMNPEPKMSYEEFKEKIQKELKANPQGLTWTELKGKLKLPQTVPNNKWVRRMEKDIGLLRIKDPRGIVWRLK